MDITQKLRERAVETGDSLYQRAAEEIAKLRTRMVAEREAHRPVKARVLDLLAHKALTTSEIAEALKVKPGIAQNTVYDLYKAGALTREGPISCARGGLQHRYKVKT